MPAYSLGTMGAWAVTSHTDQILTGAKTFQAAAAGSVPLTATAISGQTANLFDIRRPDGFVSASFNANGSLRINTPDAVNAAVGIIVKGALGQTGNLQEWQINTGEIRWSVGPTGHLLSAGSRTIIQGDTGRIQSVQENHHFGAQNPSPGVKDAAASFHATAATRAGIIVRGFASQAENLQEWQTSAGTPLCWITSTGKFFAEVADTGPSGFGLEVKKPGGGRAVNFSNYTDVDFQIQLPAPGAADKFTLVSGSTNTAIGIGTGMVERVRFEPSGAVLVRGNGFVEAGPNSTWNARIRFGGNGYTVPGSTYTASVATTNGNLHLDAANIGASGIYLNWYATGSSGTLFGNGASVQVGKVDQNGNASFVSVTSTSRMDSKREVERVLENGPSDIQLMSLSPVRYRSALDEREDAPLLHSFVAEEVQEIMPEIVTLDENGEVEGINLTSLVTILTAQVQNLTARVRELEGEV